MENKRFKPLVDKLYVIICVPTLLFLILATVISFFEPMALLIIMIPTDLFTIYVLISPLFGYVELRADSVFIKLGFIMKREIPYKKIRGLKKERRAISESMTSLKCALDHVNIKYNTYDVLTVSVVGNDELMSALECARLAE